MSTYYDAVIIGSGQGGTPLSMAFAQANKKTALIESTHVGGCCINEGCTPTKTMIASGRVTFQTRRGPEYGAVTNWGCNNTETTNHVRVAMETVRQRKRNMVDSFRASSERKVRDAGVELISGTARFENDRTIRVQLGNNGSERTLTADRFFICTGERPAAPALDGFDAGSFPRGILLDSTSIQDLETVPSHLVVIGGGYIGLEFGQLFRRLGATVTIVQRGRQLLSREDVDVSETMLRILQEDGIKVLLKASPVSIHYTGDNDSPATVSVSMSASGDPGKKVHTEELLASHILFASGRIPNTEALNLDAAGIETTARGHIVIDPQLATTNSRVWALGDVKGGPAFTHVSYDDFRLLRANLLGNGGEKDNRGELAAAARTTSDRILPYVVYTDPQLGHVGLHEYEARAKYPGRTVQVASMPMSYVARALETDEPRGVMKVVVDAESQRILGFTCLGLEGGEIMAMVQMAMIGGMKWTTLRDAVWAHPSLAESLNNIWAFLK